jgi:hypothetical protein
MSSLTNYLFVKSQISLFFIASIFCGVYSSASASSFEDTGRGVRFLEESKCQTRRAVEGIERISGREVKLVVEKKN